MAVLVVLAPSTVELLQSLGAVKFIRRVKQIAIQTLIALSAEYLPFIHQPITQVALQDLVSVGIGTLLAQART